MAIFKHSFLIFILLFSANGFALNLSDTNQSITNELYDNRSCGELYMQASALERDTYANKRGFYSDRTTRVATYAMAVFGLPIASYLGYSSFQNYKAGIRSEAALSEIEKIRYRMAEKRCFER